MPYKDKEKQRVRQKVYDKAYREAHREQIKARRKAHYEANREQIKAYREAHREQIKAEQKAYYEANREQILAKAKVYQKVHREANREQVLARRRAYYSARQPWLKDYNLTPEQYNTMLDTQGFTCAICGVPELAAGKRLAVDHCHTTGKIRKLLCKQCNLGLGCFQDDPERLERATKYLYYHQKVAQWESE